MIDINKLKALHEAATQGPWELDMGGCIDRIKLASPWVEDAWEGDAEAMSNAALIVALRNALPDIIADYERLIDELHWKDIRIENLGTYLRAAVRDLEQQVKFGEGCKSCSPRTEIEYPCARCCHDYDNWHTDEDNWRWRGHDEFVGVPPNL